MEKVNVPVELPNSKLITALVEKSNNKPDIEINYVHELDKIRQRISIEVSRINLLFPEYTPHDEKYHLKRLFYVADLLLGDSLIENMNVTELFLICVALYGHDWGMAVSEEEKSYILSGCEGEFKLDYGILDDEKIRIKEFCRTRNIEISEIDLSDWREYIRLTHAIRSGKRIKDYFESISSGIAEFASRICEGHWVNFDVLDDYTSYPTDAAIHREIVNVKALTVYVRLVDLLDLGEDRTPFVLWKFVAPRNKFSQIEWAKHRSLQPVSFPNYQHTRYIQVDGSTDDQDVYMSIMDLKRYVDDQFRQCLDILNRINHHYHKLNISHIDWRIAARGFEPVAIQFEFERSRMFEILGDEIYKSNPYIFIRELLQNSIDAIEIRTQLLQKKGLTFLPKIEIVVFENSDFYTIKISDNGIGMDDYIIRNYLAVAGKSYYRSIDFQREGLKMDPISRFGIGVLSCFMVAEHVEIETYKDPNTTQKQEHIKLSIPSKENYFKLKINSEKFEIGTTFKVIVIKKKLPAIDKEKKPFVFNIANYLKASASFVKFPILINENGSTLVIKNPNLHYDTKELVYTIDYSFPINKAISPQHIGTVKCYFVEKKIHLRTDLGLSNYEGCITYLVPISTSIDIINVGRSWPIKKVKIIDFNTDMSSEEIIEWKNEWTSLRSYSIQEKNGFSIPERPYSVFMDGILIPEITPPDMTIKDEDGDDGLLGNSSYYESFIVPQLIVNIPKPVGMKIDLARTNIESKERWDKPIWKALYVYLKDNLIKDIESEEINSRLLSYAKVLTYYRVSQKILIQEMITKSKFVLPFLSEEAKLSFEEYGVNKYEHLKVAPLIFSYEYYNLLKSSYFDFLSYSGVLDLWIGNKVVLNLNTENSFGEGSSSINNLIEMVNYFLKLNYYMHSIEFISSPLGNNYSLVQEIIHIKQSSCLIKKDWGMYNISNIGSLSAIEIYQLNTILKEKISGRLPVLVNFPEPYLNSFAYSFKYLNFNDDRVRRIVILCLSFISVKELKSASDDIIGNLSDKLSVLNFDSNVYEDKPLDLLKFNKNLNTLFSEASMFKIIDNELVKTFEITYKDFVNNSIEIYPKKHNLIRKKHLNEYIKGKQNWGAVLTEIK